ncbi:SnoaL-like domain-containing protein [Streptomyces sp. LamerLS-316]|uniref:nuclear transport factor 2 family protein n=1 Tax=unclassified Streptomyces TaxID=2593676 RepID=UPI0008239AFE|nr:MULTISPECIES: nuclear transport factor 2 family protein [unclassified Streptomyces]MYQ41500.1 nuclear transport factor 2 family protein [Streptomyces sp. SID4921]SCK10637.1 SnoaL-like domain-containing protein [Streptomyces sp. LamerLS-316]
MTQRVALATVMDRLSIDAVITDYAVAVGDGAWEAYGALFTPGGRADYRGAGGSEGPAAEAARWLAESLRPFPARQHLIVNRRLDLQDLGGYPGDRAQVRADHLSPVGREAWDGESAPALVTGGRYVFELRRTEPGWRIHTVTAHRTWRYAPG